MERSLSSSLRRRPVHVATLLVLSLVGALGLAACGDTVGYTDPSSGDKIHGKELFKQDCGSCHTLADAGTTGTIGPNLDYAFLQSRQDGLGENAILQVVRGQIAYAVTTPSTGAPGMPAQHRHGPGRGRRRHVRRLRGRASTRAVRSSTRRIRPSRPSPAGRRIGKTVFATAGCAGCHTLKAAGSTGTVGPNLDEAKPSKELVIDRVTNGKGGMPSFKGQLSEAQIQAVADYVSANAGK